jgi:tetratricopeptide (TPR) repeat protein
LHVACLLSVIAASFLGARAALAQEEAPWVGTTLGGIECARVSGGAGAYGPFDYTNPRHFQNKLPVVEREHFTRKVESLRDGENSGTPLGDLQYTLRAFPNHHRALFAMIRYHTEEGHGWSDTGTESGAVPPECFLQRAAAFAPNDPVVTFLHGLYLHRIERYQQAAARYRQALEARPDAAEFHYNFGLLLTETGRYSEAQRHARRAYDLGYPLPGLRQRLADAGHPLD